MADSIYRLLKLWALALCVPLAALSQTLIAGSRVIAGSLNFGTDSGTASAYVIGNSPSSAKILAYIPGYVQTFIATHASAANATASVDGLSALPIKTRGGTSNLAAGDIAVGGFVELRFDGAVWQMVSPVANVAVGSSGMTQLAGDVTTPPNSSGATIATLPVVNNTPGIFGSSTQSPVITVDGKGRVTGVTTATISGGGSGLTALNPSPAGSYGSSSAIPVLTVDVYGRVTNASTVAPTGGSGGSGTATAVATGTAGSRPNPNAGGIYYNTSDPTGMGLEVSDGMAWYRILNFDSTLSCTSGLCGVNPSVVARLTAPQTFTGLQTMSAASITDLYVPPQATSPGCGTGSRGHIFMYGSGASGTADHIVACVWNGTSLVPVNIY